MQTHSSGEGLRPHLHLIAGGRAQEGNIKVEVGRLLDAALVDGASWRDPHNHLEQVCTAQALLSGFHPRRSMLSAAMCLPRAAAQHDTAQKPFLQADRTLNHWLGRIGCCAYAYRLSLCKQSSKLAVLWAARIPVVSSTALPRPSRWRCHSSRNSPRST